MSSESHDPREIPILTETIKAGAEDAAPCDFDAAHAAILAEALKLADSLLRQAARDIDSDTVRATCSSACVPSFPNSWIVCCESSAAAGGATRRGARLKAE